MVLEHDDNGKKVYTLYAHLSSFKDCPQVGATVTKGTKIGVMGSTGNSTGPHLHFGIFDKKSTDPYGYAYSAPQNHKAYRGGFTFYDPGYVIKNNKLPK